MKVVCLLVICYLTSGSRAEGKKEPGFVEKLLKAIARVEKLLKVGLKDLSTDSQSKYEENTEENNPENDNNDKVVIETEEEVDNDEEDEDTNENPSKDKIIESTVLLSPTTANVLSTSNTTKTTQQMTITTSSHNPTKANPLSAGNKTETSTQMTTTTSHPYLVRGQNKSATKNSSLVDILGTLESVILKDVLVLQNNGKTTQIANISTSGIPLSTQAPTVPTTFPGAYQGYSPVMKKVPTVRHVRAYKTTKHVSLKKLVKRSASQKRRHSPPLNNKISKRKIYLTPKERRKLQREITKQLQMTILKSTKCEEHVSGSVGTDVLKELWEIRKLLTELGFSLRNGVRRLGNQEEDNSNEERSDIRTNSDKITNMQKDFLSKIDDLNTSLSLLMTTQNKMVKIIGGTLAGMMEVFRQIIDVVIKDQKALNISMLSIKAQTNKTDIKFPGTENNTQSSHILRTREIHPSSHKRSKTDAGFNNDQIHIRNSNSAVVVRSRKRNEKARLVQQRHSKANSPQGLKITVTKSADCSHADTEVLREVVKLRKSLKKLGKTLNKGVHQIVNQAVDNTNEERSDIKTNSDRISQLEESLSRKIDDLRYNISLLMMSQRDLGHTFSNTLSSMMLFFRQIVSVVTGDQTEFNKIVPLKILKQNETEKMKSELNRFKEQNSTNKQFLRLDSNQEHNKNPLISNININTLARHDSEVARNNLIRKMNSSMSVVTP